MRESGLGATARVPAMPDTWPGWEDSAVAPDRLGDYLRDLRELYDEFGYEQASRLRALRAGLRAQPDPVRPADRRRHRRLPRLRGAGGRPRGRPTAGRSPASTATARQRGELLPKMFGARGRRGVRPVQGDLRPGRPDEPRQGRARPTRSTRTCASGVDYDHGGAETAFQYPHDEGSFGRAVLRCVGVGKCRRHEGGVMCPSYMVTQRGGALHPRPGAAALRDARRHPARRGRSPTAGGRPTSATRSTCAWRARAARPTAPSTSTWPRTRPSSCSTTTSGGCGRSRTTRWAGSRCGRRSPRRRPARRQRRPRTRRVLGRLAEQRSPASTEHRTAPLFAPQTFQALVRGPRARRGRAPAARWCCGPTPSPTTSTPPSRRRRWRCSRTPAGG